ncbi:hypothetical protein [Hymenobacter sp. APR13]|uniref:hypothetical protein n=1 Tax=Hymenobacter sp. APR13 TaxID=1356852 RepID=UPI0004E05C15|nr:hypothetical protein [Hymenobacter sp. APR13]AII54279.1 hypothetical protein N008_20115 [Hymenobacter sp. APR13]
MHKLLLSLLLAVGLSARAQRAYDMWYIGNYAALRFNLGGGTKLIIGSAMQLAESTASRCFTEAGCRAGTATTS